MHLSQKLLGVVACLACLIVQAQSPQVKQKTIVLKRMIEKNHFSPRPADDSLSSEMFHKIVNELDPHRNIFMEKEFNALAVYQYKLDDELNGPGWEFLNVLTRNFKQALNRSDTVIRNVLQKPLDFNSEEKITLSRTDEPAFEFSVSRSELESRWRTWFKFLMLDELNDLLSPDSSASIKSLLTKYEASTREKLMHSFSGNIQDILSGGCEEYVNTIYFNALATCFDPHTSYFSAQDKESFQAQLSTEEFSLGMTVDEDDEGKSVIGRLIPGGPAWKSGELNKDDQIIQIQLEGRLPVDASLLTAEEIDDALGETNHGNITLIVRKVNGTTKTVVLQKEKIESEENIVRSYVLRGSNKIGYISLPDFYTTWEDEKGSGCANDVAKEIVKLKRENISGLILDLRYNGGGSLGEALQMAGIFVDEGPIAGVKDRSQKLVYLKDPNRGTIYDGPLILLVNSQSASASEMVAAALQDYHRALIVGSATYGKATMQKLYPMDTMSTAGGNVVNSDVVKITDGKLYRVTGRTAQLNGVTPDIVLPDIFDVLKYHEKFSPDVLPSDTVKGNGYYKPLEEFPLAELVRESNLRIAKNKNFLNIKTAVQQQNNAPKTETVLLNPDSFEQWKAGKEQLRKAFYDNDDFESKLFIAEHHRADMERFRNEADGKDADASVLKNLQRDIYVEEAYSIILDLLKIMNQ